MDKLWSYNVDIETRHLFKNNNLRSNDLQPPTPSPPNTHTWDPQPQVSISYERGTTGVDPVAFWCVLSLEAPAADGGKAYERILPTLWSDNALALMPGTDTTVRATALLPKALGSGHVRVSVSGWHVAPASIDVEL